MRHDTGCVCVSLRLRPSGVLARYCSVSANEALLLPSTPCAGCGHRMGAHDHLFDEQTERWGKVGRYRCNKCGCGAQYMPRVYEMRDGESPEEFLDRITAE